MLFYMLLFLVFYVLMLFSVEGLFFLLLQANFYVTPASGP